MSHEANSIEAFLVHRQPMLLLDRIVSLSETEAQAEATVRPDNPFFETGRGIPSYVGLEMMAQAIACIDGMKRRNGGHDAKIGFLLGCRRYVARTDSFADGTRLLVAATMVFGDGEMFSFDCRIDDAVGEVASANIKVYAPTDLSAFLERTAP
jgi:predicted hotdog family 3-hydroxylacyl-ACP dehydratase